MTSGKEPRMSRTIRAPRGPELTAKSWQTEAPLRMLMNNLERDHAERPEDLVVYGGTGKAARAPAWAAATGRVSAQSCAHSQRSSPIKPCSCSPASLSESTLDPNVRGAC